MSELLSPAELEALRLSLAVALRSVLMSLPLAVLAAWILTRARFPGRTVLDAEVAAQEAADRSTRAEQQ